MRQLTAANFRLRLAGVCASLLAVPVLHATDPGTTLSLVGAYRIASPKGDDTGGPPQALPARGVEPGQRYAWRQETGAGSLEGQTLRLDHRPPWGNATISAAGQLVSKLAKEGKGLTVAQSGAAPPESIATSTGVAPAGVAGPTAPSAAAPHYEFRPDHDPDGIGKFYLGREIAHVLSHQGADWLERPEREEEEKPALLLEALRLRPGDVVADIGAGTGFLARRLARKVGPTGVVYANDIQPEMLDVLRSKCLEERIENVKPVLGTITDPKLPPHAIDLAIMVDVYHEFSHPHEMLAAIVRALKPGGRVVFVEYRAEDPHVPIKPVHKMSEAQVRKEAEVHPLAWVETIKVLPRQHIIVFKRKAEQ